ncbi:ATP-binding protein [Salegentibacter sp. F188]|uniref:ATP-binding protein n=1 Tax=Autumnicola patrickiae TaxID=3075591 RepID=A0ABU3E3K7_9FLAO|nr:ATP-binding protein [Salegentibacter sp. F188]MDT0690578.1 ATP-binding protein [Salegentibacter sp. F188]
MKKKKIVITGGPGTGKSSIIHQLEEMGHKCLHEISRDVIREAQLNGIEQLFLEDPLLFSRKLLEGRIDQFQEAENDSSEMIFIDRGVPDVTAYMDYLGTEYPEEFVEPCRKYQYDQIFILPPWRAIYKSDNERYESFDQASKISNYLTETYKLYGYKPILVPEAGIKERANFILNNLGS